MAVWDCGSHKAPGPDGFNFNFTKRSWDVVGEEIIEMVMEFHDKGQLPKGINSTHIMLIPKTKDTMELSKFRPITLVNSLYKIIAKLLANRL